MHEWSQYHTDFNKTHYHSTLSFPGVSAVNNLPANAGDMGLIPRMGRSPGEGNVNPLQYSLLENPMDRRVWWATAHMVTRIGHDLATKQTQKCENQSKHISLC